MKTSVLIIDDEPPIQKFLQITLAASGYQVTSASGGKEGVRLTASVKPDLVICDLGLPDMDGNEVIQAIREWSQIPIIVLSVRSGEADVVKALDLGADDYLCKPFSTEILLARLRAALRKSVEQEHGDTMLEAAGISMDLLRHEVSVRGQIVDFSPKEYKLLQYFLRHAGRMLTHRQLIEAAWGRANDDQIQYLRIYIGQIRQKIEPDPAQPRYIVNEPGIGYRLEVGS